MLFFKKGIEAEQGTQKTLKTGKRKSKNDHASAVRVQKLLNRPFFYKGTDCLFSNPKSTQICRFQTLGQVMTYADKAFA